MTITAPRPVISMRGANALSMTERLNEWVFLVKAGESPLLSARRLGWTTLASVAKAAAREGHDAAAVALRRVAA